MPIIDLDYDLGDVQSDFPVMPQGDYIGRIEEGDIELKESSNGNPMLSIKWTVIDGEYEGRTLFDNVPLHVDWKVKQYADASGIESGKQFDTADLIGTEAVLSVNQREYEGEMRNNIKKVKAQ